MEAREEYAALAGQPTGILARAEAPGQSPPAP
jgi:hypothetical protein